jgi:hypothetical protein
VLQNPKPRIREFSQSACAFGSIPAMHYVMMNKTESDRIHELCSLIAVEQDRRKFLELVGELNRLLEVNDERLKGNEVGS